MELSNESIVKTGIKPINGQISKHKSYQNGIAISYLSIHLDYVLPQNLPEIIEQLNEKMKLVESDFISNINS